MNFAHLPRLGNPAFLPRNRPCNASARSYGAYFTQTPISRFSLRRHHLLWLVPIAGTTVVGVSAFLKPTPVLSSSLFASSTLIPCKEQPTPVIFSVAETGDQAILRRILSLLKHRIWEPLLTAKRFVYLFFLFMPVIICSPILLVGIQEKRFSKDSDVGRPATHGSQAAVWWYDLLVSKMQAAGPTFIKLSQWAASRADLFPSDLCERLGALHSQGKPHPFSHTKRVIESVFQRPFDDVFEEFEQVPIGTGAIAQVYRATLKHDLIPPWYLGPKRSKKLPLNPVNLNEPPPSVPTASVAIKILHPHVAKTISRDLSIMNFFARFISLFPGMEWLSLPEEVEVFGKMMFQQIDLRHEAENLEAFERNFAPRKLTVTFPRPLKLWSTKNLLVEEFQYALPLELFLKNGGGHYDDQLATVGLDAFLNMLLLDNFVHSDLHPGNIMVKFAKPPTATALLKNMYASVFRRSAKTTTDPFLNPDYSDSDAVVARLRDLASDRTAWLAELDTLNESGYIPEIVFIDAGLVTTLSEVNRRNFLDLFRAVAEFDGYRTGQLMVSRCRSPELAVDTETFALKMQHLVLSVKRKTFSLGQIKISDILTDVLRAVRDHHVRMEGDFINTVISILLLEGIGRQLDPGLDLFKSALPILRQVGGQMAAGETWEKAGISLPSGELGAVLKVWIWMEARTFISNAIVNADDLIKLDWLMPNT